MLKVAPSLPAHDSTSIGVMLGISLPPPGSHARKNILFLLGSWPGNEPTMCLKLIQNRSCKNSSHQPTTAVVARFPSSLAVLLMGTPMQALQQENAQLMARLAEMQAECQPTEEYAEVMNKAIADAAEAETQRDTALARVEQLEAQLRATRDWAESESARAIESNARDLLRQVERERVGIDLLRQLDDR